MNIVPLVLASLVALVEVFLGVAVMYRNPRGVANRWFATTCALGVVWITLSYLSDYPPAAADVLLLNRLSVAAAFLTSASAIVLVLHMPAGARPGPAWWALVAPGALVAAVSALTPYMVLDVQPVVWGYSPLFGVWYEVGLVWGAVTLLAMSVRCHRRLVAADAADYPSLRLLYGGGLAAGIALIALGGVLPLATGSAWSAMLAPFAALLFLAPTALAIMRHNLFEFEVSIIRGAVHAFALIGVAAVLLGAVTLTSMELERRLGLAPGAIIFGSVLVLVLSFPFIRDAVAAWTDEFLYQRSYDRSQVLAQVAGSVGRTLDPHQIAAQVAHALEEGMRIESVKVAYRDDGANHITDIHADPYVVGRVMDSLCSTGTYVVDRGAMDREVAADVTALGGRVAVRFVEDNWAGVTVIAGPKRSGARYTDADLELLTIAASECGAAINNALLFEERNQRVRELTELNTLATAIASETDVQALLDRSVRQIVMLTAADAGNVMLTEDSGDYLLIAAGTAHSMSSSAIRTRVGQGPVGWVALNKQTLRLPDVEHLDLSLDGGTRSALLAPLVFQERVIGVITVERLHSPTPFSAENLSVLESFAHQLAIALENARLYSDLEDTFLGTISALAAAVDAKDPYTFGHSNEVTEHSVAIAQWMGLDEPQVKTIRIAAMLHDIGKIGIDASILNKPGKLTDDEYAEMCRHPAIGADILAPLGFLRDAVPMILFHHEKFGGGGYPSGIQGQAIPLGARILQVADAYNAMVSDRPYRAGMPAAEAIEELRRCAGTQFDPQVVLAFVSVLRHEHAIVRPEFVTIAGGVTPPPLVRAERTGA